MKFSSALSLFAAGVLAAPAEQQQQSPSMLSPVSGPMAKGKRTFGTNTVQQPWGGAIQEATGWKTVTGTTVIPKVTGQSSTAGAAAWVGIDGANCQRAILQTGITTWGDGTVAAWYEWYPALPTYYKPSEFAVKAGDQVRMSVVATSATSGTSMLENLTTGKKVTTPFKDQPALCLTDAEWIIEFGGGATEFANFGTWAITNTSATGTAGTVSANGGTISNVVINNKQRTKCSTSASGMSCTWQ